MKEKLLALIRSKAEEKVVFHDKNKKEDMFIEAKNKFRNKEIIDFFAKYPYTLQNKVYYCTYKYRELLSEEELKEHNLDGKTYYSFSLCFSKDIGGVDNSDEFLAIIKSDPELFKMIKEDFLKEIELSKYKKEMTYFIESCTTDKQILATFPELEQFFNEAGIVKPEEGTTLPVSTSLTNLATKYL